MKKAVIVTAVVKTRIIIDEKDSFETIAIKAKDNLVRNLSNDLFDNIESVEADNEMPYGAMIKDYLEDFFVNDFFWREMENIALNNGMRYYDDMCEEEYLAIKNRK